MKRYGIGSNEPDKKTPAEEAPKEEASLKNFSGAYKQNSVVRVNLNSEKYADAKQRLLTQIKDETGRIFKEYQEEQYYETRQAAEDEYIGTRFQVNFPFSDSSNRRLLLTTLIVDIIASKGRRQTWGISPAVTMEPEEEEISADELSERAELLDHRFRNDIGIEILSEQIYREACLYGSCVVKVPFAHEAEYFVTRTTYEGAHGAEQFEKKYIAKLEDGDPKYVGIWKRLKKGEDVTVREELEQVRKHGPAPYIVDLKNFYARLKIKDLYRHICIGEEFMMTWYDLETRVSQGFYDKIGVDALQNRNKEYRDETYKIREDTVMFDLEGNGKLRRFIVTYDTASEEILRCIYYPYRHGKIHYVIYSGIPRKDSWLGFSFHKRLEDLVSICNTFLNSAINEYTLGHTTTIITDDQETRLDRISLENLSVIRMKTGSKFQPIKFDYSSMDRVAFLNWIVNFAELLTGVNASLMSGAETPEDPRAPARKTELKYRSSNMRIEDVIHNLQAGDADLAEQCDKIYYQYPASDADTIEYFRGTTRKVVSRNVFDKGVRYVMQGSKLSFDKNLDMNVAMGIGKYLQEFYPEVWRDPEARYEILDIVLMNTEGSVEHRREAIIKPLKAMVDAQRKIREVNKKLGPMPQGTDQALRDRATALKKAQEEAVAGAGAQQQPPAAPEAQPAPAAAAPQGGNQ